MTDFETFYKDVPIRVKRVDVFNDNSTLNQFLNNSTVPPVFICEADNTATNIYEDRWDDVIEFVSNTWMTKNPDSLCKTFNLGDINEIK